MLRDSQKLTSRGRRTTAVQKDDTLQPGIGKYASEYSALLESLTSFITRSKIQTWTQLLDSFLSTPVSSGHTTPNLGETPAIMARAPPR